ncbi:hypothetical protein [Tessaracoccus sp. Z1128]
MNRSILSSVVAMVASLAMTACSGSPADTASTTPDDAPTTTAAASAAPATSSDADTGTEQSVAEACMSMAEPIAEAGEKLSEIASVGTGDPQSAVDSWSTLVDAYRSVADTVTNPEVKAAAIAVRDDLATLRDAMEKAYVDQDMGAMSEFTDATSAWQASQTELQTLCAS